MKSFNIHLSILAFVACMMTILFTACGESHENTVDNWKWDKGKGKTTQTDEAKPRYMWIDAPANFSRFANSRENIVTDLTKARDCGITHVIVDVRPYTGDVLFKSNTADAVTQLDYWEGSQYKYYQRTATWDYLQAFIDEGHKLGLKVYAGMNTFVGGCMNPYGLGGQGLLFRDASKKSWASVYNRSEGLVNGMDLPQSADNYYATRFLDPCNDDVQTYLLNIISDLAKYNVDGIVLDRCRFDNLLADFSNDARAKFVTYMKNKGVNSFNFPADVAKPGERTISGQPQYFKDWLAFRCKTIYDFMARVTSKVHAINSKTKVGVYVGAWYSSYYDVGVNWASPKYDPSQDYPQWANADYRKYGYAALLDFMLLGCYAPAANVYGNGEWTMQGFCLQAREKLKGDVPFAGGPDVGNPTGFEHGNQATAVTQSVNACIGAADGYFIFDMVHVRQFNYWNALKQGIDNYLTTLKK